jgi:SAM-dependent methyltransferase
MVSIDGLKENWMSNTCNLCGQGNFSVYLSNFSEEKRRILKCENCGLLVTDPFPTEEELVYIYQDDFYGKEKSQRFGSFLEKVVYLFRRARTQKIKRLLKPGSVLDVGCGRGITLYFLKKWGWNCTGTQLSKNAAEYARSAFGLKIYEGDLLEAKFADESFDLVILAHVLEHVPDPLAYLREISRILTRKGVLILELPNAGNFLIDIFKEKWFGWDLPRHLYHFTPGTITRMLSQAGFKVVKKNRFSLEYAPYVLLQSSLNMIFKSRNLLFEIIKAPEMRKFSNLQKSRLIVHLSVAVFLFLPVLLFSIGESLFGSGDIMGFWSIKKSHLSKRI